MRGCLIALQFLTSIPIRVKGKISDRELAHSMLYFPLVGAFLGGALALIYLLFRAFLPHLVVCCLLIVSEILLTRALHLDGLADTIDGLSAGKNRQETLSIMRKGEVGAFGVIGLVMIILAKLTLLYSLPRPYILGGLILMATYGRWSLVFSAYFYPYARKEGGKGKPFVGLVKREEMVLATVIMFVGSIIFARWATTILFLVLIAGLVAFNSFLKKRIGGVTGDTLGAGCELVEVIALMVMVGLKG